MLLVSGSGGLLGRHAADYFPSVGRPVVLASHQPGADVHLDLRQHPKTLADSLPPDIGHALICGSLTNIDDCRRDPEGTREFNVTHTIALIQVLLDLAITPIFCSTDLVFKGNSGNYAEEHRREPTTLYGHQKVAVEDFLLGQDLPFLIIRMSKLYSLGPDDPSPIGQMLNALAKGSVIRCADDQVVCPTWAGDIPRAVETLVNSRATGVYHLAAPQQYSRHTLGVELARSVGREDLVERCSINSFDFLEPRPVDNSLDVTKFLTEPGFTFSTLGENMAEILGNRNQEPNHPEHSRQVSV